VSFDEDLSEKNVKEPMSEDQIKRNQWQRSLMLMN
jgi:hypothetical protein